MQPPVASVSIWREGAFVRVWTAASISYVGSFISRTALPLTAIIVLGAGPLEISALRSLEWVALLLVGLVAGAWVDRLRRRPIMIVTDLGRALLLGSIPVAAIAGVLSPRSRPACGGRGSSGDVSGKVVERQSARPATGSSTRRLRIA